MVDFASSTLFREQAANEGDRVTYSIEVDSKSGKHCAENIRLVA
jgi:hypothetical protein